MNPEQHQLLTLSVLPARLSAEQAAQLLGFQAHELTVLIAVGLLRPLGRPAANAPKFFATVELEGVRRDAKWLSKATDAVQNRWWRKNRTAAKSAAPGSCRHGRAQPVPCVRSSAREGSALTCIVAPAPSP
jgi:hypothetical protein